MFHLLRLWEEHLVHQGRGRLAGNSLELYPVAQPQQRQRRHNRPIPTVLQLTSGRPLGACLRLLLLRSWFYSTLSYRIFISIALRVWRFRNMTMRPWTLAWKGMDGSRYTNFLLGVYSIQDVVAYVWPDLHPQTVAIFFSLAAVCELASVLSPSIIFTSRPSLLIACS